MENLKKMLNLKNWNPEHSSVYFEIVSRFGQTDYDDVTKRKAHQEALKKEYEAKAYQRNRQYPSIGDQLDMQYHDSVNGTSTWKDAIAKVKSDNPKGRLNE